MLRNRVLTLLGGCLLLGSASLADDLGYVDCASHPEETQLFAKARKSQDVVANIPCGERVKVVLYGFIFSEVQTADGKVGFVYSSILTIDRGGTLQARAASADNTPKLSAASETTKIPADPKPAAQPKRAPVSPTASAAPAPAGINGANAGATSSNSNSVNAQPAASQTAASATAVSAAPAAASATQSDSAAAAGSGAAAMTPTEAPAASAAPAATEKTAEVATNNLPTPPTTPAAAEAAAEAAVSAAAGTAVSTPATEPAAAPPDATSNNAAAPATDAPTPAPEPTAAAEPAAAPARPQPAEVEPGTPSAKVKTESWEKPNPGGRSTSLLEFFGGFAYARNTGSGVSNNFIGGVGAFGFNVKPWLQIAGDSSYNYYNVSGAKYVLYGNHYGPRFFLRQHNPLHRFFGITPFGEALFGGSREDVNWPASGGYSAYTTSTNAFSWKVGGGVDMRASRLFEIRLIDVDYYRTSFGGTNQSNYFVSTGIVLKLFHGSAD